jgi:hypothetical protein
MELPRSLPATAYLLAYDPEKGRWTARRQFGLVLRAAAVAELVLREKIVDDHGKPRVADPAPVADPVLDMVLADLSQIGRRSWHRSIDRRGRDTVLAVREQLESAGWLRVERRTLLPDRVEPRETYRIKQAAAELRRVLTVPGAPADARSGALLALAASGEVTSLLRRAERRTYRKRLAELSDPIGPVADGLKRALRAKRAAAAASA